MKPDELEAKKKELLQQVQPLVEKKKRLYGNAPIDSPMSAEEKQLQEEIAALYSEVNAIIRQRNNLLKGLTP